MKTNASLLRQLAAIAATSVLTLTGARAQTTATTDPVGFITLNVYGGSAAAPRFSLVSPTLTQPVAWQGAITVDVTGKIFTVSGAPWTANQFTNTAYVELISVATPTKTGTLSDITATTTNSITTFDVTGAVTGDTIKIRPDVTISNLLGATNSAGLNTSSIDATTADEVLIYNGSTSKSYFYYSGTDLPYTPGWVDSVTFADASQITIAPSEAVVIKRKIAGNLPIVFNGAVKTGNTLIPIQTGLSVLGTSSAKGLTLATSGLFTGNPVTGVKASSIDATTADEIILYSATGSTTSYFYYSGTDLPYTPGWVDSITFADASTIPIAPGTAFVLKRKNGGAPFNWVLPSPTSF